MSWIQTAYLIAEIIAIAADRMDDARVDVAMAVCRSDQPFYPRLGRLRVQRQFCDLIGFRVLQGFAGGTLIPAVFSAVFLLFPIRLHPIATTLAGIMAVLAPTVGPVVGGWITDTYSWHWLFLINVIPGIIAAAATPLLLPRDTAPLCRSGDTRRLFAGADGHRARKPRDRPQAGPAIWLAFAACRCPVPAVRHRGSGLCVQNAQGRASGGRTVDIGHALVCDRLRAQFLPWRRIVRLGLSDAGVSRLCAPPRCIRNRHHHAGHRRRATARPHQSPARWKAGSIRAGCRRRGLALFALRARLAARFKAASPISTRCSGRRSCVASPSCSACCRRPGWRSAH